LAGLKYLLGVGFLLRTVFLIKLDKRSIVEFDVDSKTAAEVLARTVIKSIHAMIYEHECLPMILCEGNKQARVIGHGFQYLMPVYR
jgi:hypothetical protein